MEPETPEREINNMFKPSGNMTQFGVSLKYTVTEASSMVGLSLDSGHANKTNN